MKKKKIISIERRILINEEFCIQKNEKRSLKPVNYLKYNQILCFEFVMLENYDF